MNNFDLSYVSTLILTIFESLENSDKEFITIGESQIPLPPQNTGIYLLFYCKFIFLYSFNLCFYIFPSTYLLYLYTIKFYTIITI